MLSALVPQRLEKRVWDLFSLGAVFAEQSERQKNTLTGGG
jgi:hypothetical protein